MEKNDDKITFSKLIWIFIIGGIAGYVFETSHYFIKHGVFMNKQGLLYGPIKPIYGFAAIILSTVLSFIKDKKNFMIFVYGSLIGGAFEYICSIVLEVFFKTNMWSYSRMGLHIDGRVYLPYLPFWGLISLAWLRVVYPNLNKIFNKVPKKAMLIGTILISCFMIFNSSISTVAVWRMRERAKEIPATNSFEKFLDKHYPDEYIMKRIPYLKIVD